MMIFPYSYCNKKDSVILLGLNYSARRLPHSCKYVSKKPAYIQTLVGTCAYLLKYKVYETRVGRNLVVM